MAKNLTIPQKEDLKNRISELYLRGLGVGRMAAEVSRVADYSVSHTTVSRHLKGLLKEWYDAREKDIDIRINAELNRINEVEYEAWQAWQRSCKTKTKKTSKRKGTPYKKPNGEDAIKADYVSDTEQTEEMIGDPRFLDIIQRCIDTRLQWLTKGKDTGTSKASTNITNNIQLVMSSQERYVPPKLRQFEAQVVNTGTGKLN